VVGGRDGPAFQFGVFELDPAAGELRKRGVRIKLQDQSLQILRILLEHPGEIVTKDELRRQIWTSDTFVDFDHGLHSAMARLREALGDSSESPVFIETLPRRGYRFIASVQTIQDAAGTESSRFPEPAPKPSPHRLRWFVGSLLAGLAGGALLLGIVFGLNLGGARRWLRRQSNRPIHSLAVLPFENLSADPAQEYFTDGMTEALITDLAQIEHLRVISRTSVMRFKSSSKSLPDIARELNVEAILEGSVLRSGNRVRVTALLVDATNDQHLWAGTYERDLGDILMMQGEMSRAIADEIRVQLTPQQKQRFASAPPVDPQVYELCLLGRYQWNKRTEAGLKKAIEYFQQAVDRDPNYAPAHAGIAQVYAVLPYYSQMQPEEAFPKAKAAAQRAIALDETLAEAHTTLALVDYSYDLDWAGADQNFKRAMDLNPSYATAHHGYAFYLWMCDRKQEALAEIERARQLDPLSLVINADEGTFLHGAHEPDLAITVLKRAIELDPNFGQAHRTLALVYVQKQQIPVALSEARTALSLGNDPITLSMVGYVYAVAGKTDAAGRLLARLDHGREAGTVSAIYPAIVNVGLGKPDRALDLLEETYRSRSRGMLLFTTQYTLFESLAHEPRFQSLQRQIKSSQNSGTPAPH